MIEAKETLTGNIISSQNINGVINTKVEVVSPTLEDLEVTPTKEEQVFTHENSDGYDNVTVNPIPDEYIIPSGTLDINVNGETDVTMFRMARIGVHTPPTLQDKTVTITENGTQSIAADEGYDGLANVQVDVQVAGGGSSTTTINVFAQETEPETKEGIWLQTNKEYEKVVLTDYKTHGTTWRTETTSTIPFNYSSCYSVKYGDDIYMVGGYKNPNAIYKYNVATDTYTKLSDSPIAYEAGSCVLVGDDIYFGCTYKVNSFAKYNIPTDTYTILATPPRTIYGAASVEINGKIYAVGSGHTRSYANRMLIYDIATNKWTDDGTVLPNYYAHTQVFGVDKYIYIVAARIWGYSGATTDTWSYKYDTVNKIFIPLSKPPTDISTMSLCVDGNNVYLFTDGGISNYVNYVYHISTDTYTKMSDLPRTTYSSPNAIKYNDRIMILGGGVEATNNTVLSLFIPETTREQYEGNTIIIENVSVPINRYTKLCNYNMNDNVIGFDNPTYYFQDVVYQSSDGTIDKTIPTYYGDGTQWIKFKN